MHVTRAGGKNCSNGWKNRFFQAPLEFHCACEGGLVQHSVNVFQVLEESILTPMPTPWRALPSAACCMIFARHSIIRFPRQRQK